MCGAPSNCCATPPSNPTHIYECCDVDGG
jgi:hypothetical protein